MSYARYLMSVKLGRKLTKDEHVDHIDEDKTNDDIDNLQILTPEQNKAKNLAYRRQQGILKNIVILECPICDTVFAKAQETFEALESMKVRVTCSKSCSAKLLIRTGKSKISSKKKIIPPDQIAFIKELRLEGKSDYTIADLTGIGRAKVQRVRKELNIP